MFKPFWVALGLLTRLPIPMIHDLQERDYALSALYHPLVGLIVGLILSVLAWLLAGSAPILVSAILVMVWAMVTGGLHLDGLADGADAWLGGLGDQEKTHQILKDPLVGSAGVIALVCVLLLKFATLYVLLEQQLYGLILLAPVLGRSYGLLLLLSTPYVRENGLASSMVNLLPKPYAWGILAGVALVSGLLSFWALALSFIIFWLLRRLMMQRLGGCTGDMIGATIEVTEVFWMLGFALLL